MCRLARMQMCRNVSLQLRAYELRLRRVKPSTHQIKLHALREDGSRRPRLSRRGQMPKVGMQPSTRLLDECAAPARLRQLACLHAQAQTHKINLALLLSVAALCHCCAFKQCVPFCDFKGTTPSTALRAASCNSKPGDCNGYKRCA